MLYGKELATALASAIELKGVTDADVARAFSVRPPSVFEWKQTGRMHKKHIPKLLSYFQDVVGPEHWGLEAQDEAPRGQIVFSVLDICAAAGRAIIPIDNPQVVRKLSVNEEWAQQEFGGKLSRISLITAKGDSMRGTIEDGDVLFVDASVKLYTTEGIYVLWDGEGIQVKRLQRLFGGGLRIISDNPAYPAQDVHTNDQAAVIVCGRVLGAWNLRKFL